MLTREDVAPIPARTLKPSAACIDFIKGFELFVPHVYDDLVPPVKGKYREWKGEKVKGTLTIGYGHTDAAKHPLKIKKGLRITEAEACEILAADLEDCCEQVRKQLKVPVTQGQFDACVSFCFNCGPGNFANIARRINRKDFAGARAAFDLYVKSKGKTLRGLQRRRDGEQALWDSVEPAPIAVADTFHPAEVDDPPDHLPTPEVPQSEPDSPKDKSPGRIKFDAIADLAATSRKWFWLRWQKFIGAGTVGLGLVGASPEDDPVGAVRTVRGIWTEFGLAWLIVIGLLIYIFASRVQGRIVKDKIEGRYKASGEPADA